MDPDAHWATPDRGPPAPRGSGNPDPVYRCERCGLYNKRAEARIERLEMALREICDPYDIDYLHRFACIARRALAGEDT